MAKFVNPYNFIPFEEAIPLEKKREEVYSKSENLLSGWLDVALYMKTPLIIPNGAYPLYIDYKTERKNIVTNPSESEKKKLHKKYSFMKYGDSYVVPGSELRGMMRSVYEAVTNSCVHELMDDKPISQRVPTDSAISKRGLLSCDDGQWVLYSAKKILVKKFEPKNREEANRFKKEIIAWSDLPGKKYEDETYLQYNVPVALTEEQPYSIYKLQSMEPVKKWDKGDDTPYKELKSALERDGVKGNQSNLNNRCMDALLCALEETKNGKDKKVPVYYFAVNRGDETLVYMSGSSIGRIGHHRKWADVLEGHTPCKGPGLCPACLLFGSIKEGGLKGRVRFTDAYNRNQDIKGEYHTLGILGEPRSSAFEFYFRKPADNALFWNLDFWSHKNKEGFIEFHDLERATPRGRKMYWHGKPLKDEEMSHMNNTMECLSGDSPFEFRVFFDGITKEQLNDLKWVITLGENKIGSLYRHKLGHAKPLGYGSVKLVIEKENIRTLEHVEDEINYYILEKEVPDNIEPASINKESISVRSVLAMTNSGITEGKFVEYPCSTNKKGETTVFNWFSGNRRNLKNVKVLPEPTAQNIELDGSSKSGNPVKESSRSIVSREGQFIGKIKFFDTGKGFGFIAGSDGNDYFVHINNVICDSSLLLKGTKVTFGISKSKKGYEARNVDIK